jgi:hypothetical protein
MVAGQLRAGCVRIHDLEERQRSALFGNDSVWTLNGRIGGVFRLEWNLRAIPAKSGAERGRSEQCLRNRLRGSNWGSSGGTRVPSEPRNLAQGPALAPNSLGGRAEEVYRAQAGGPNRKFPLTPH